MCFSRCTDIRDEMLAYKIKTKADDNGTLLITCPALPEVTTFAESKAEVALRVRDGIEEAIAARMADREDIPKGVAEKHLSEPDVVAISALPAMKVALYDRMRKKGITKAELARLLQWHGPQVDRVLDIRHSSRIDQMEAAFGALGLKLDVGVREEKRRRAARANA
jgi:antitoxin HicB